MLATPHLLAGAAVASSGLPPDISLPLCFLSHFVLDAIPHFETSAVFIKFRKLEDEMTQPEIVYAFFDVLIGSGLVLYFYFLHHNPLILWGAFLALLPDIVDNVPFWYGIRKFPVFKQLHQVHDFVHFTLDPQHWFWGIFTQVIILGISIYFLV